MSKTKRTTALVLGLALGTVSLAGCYTKVDADNYSTTAVATFGSETVYLSEVNFYVKMMQVTYDQYYDYFYQSYYGFESKKDFYSYTGMTDDGTTIWDAMKEDAMAAVMQTYILCSHAEEYGVSLSDEDLTKVDDAVAEFFEDADTGIVEACKVDEEELTEIYKRNALASRVWEYIVKDIDTEVNEEDYRYTNVAYLQIALADDDTSSNDADSTEEEEVDLSEKANEILEELKEQVAVYEESGEDDDSIPYNAVIDAHEDDTDIEITYTSSKEYAKPEDTEDSDDSEDSEEGDDDSSDSDDTQTTETLQSKCWNDLSTGDYAVWYDETNEKAYVIYCINDDVEDSKEEAIQSELDDRKDTMFNEKYPDIVKNSSSFDVISRVYSQLVYEDINYSDGTDTSGNDASEND